MLKLPQPPKRGTPISSKKSFLLVPVSRSHLKWDKNFGGRIQTRQGCMVAILEKCPFKKVHCLGWQYIMPPKQRAVLCPFPFFDEDLNGMTDFERLHFP